MKYNIIGDIHSRTSWKELVREDCINIFVGDYFAPYKKVPFEEQVSTFMELVLYKGQHPKTVLLLGNHDDQHWKNVDRFVSRFDSYHQKEIANLFEENKSLLSAAYSIENKILVTHAGVGGTWYFNRLIDGNNANVFDLSEQKYDDLPSVEQAIDLLSNDFPFGHITHMDKMVVYFHNSFFVYLESESKWEEIEIDIDTIADNINKWWNDDHKYKWFNFKNNAGFGDYYGTSSTQGPMWIRPTTLVFENILKGEDNKYQVVGHTMFEHVTNEEGIYFVDCLEYNKESLIIDINGNNIKFEINKI